MRLLYISLKLSKNTIMEHIQKNTIMEHIH